jgi:hypothetical protein
MVWPIAIRATGEKSWRMLAAAAIEKKRGLKAEKTPVIPNKKNKQQEVLAKRERENPVPPGIDVLA